MLGLHVRGGDKHVVLEFKIPIVGYLVASALRVLPNVQYRHLIPAPIDRTYASAWLYKHPWVTSQNNSQTH